MTKTSEASEVEKVIGACEARLAAPEEWKPFPGYPDSLALSVLDSIWSINAATRSRGGLSSGTERGDGGKGILRWTGCPNFWLSTKRWVASSGSSTVSGLVTVSRPTRRHPERRGGSPRCSGST